MTDRRLQVQKWREKSRRNSRAVFAVPWGAAWCDNYQWGKQRGLFTVTA
jgi:hypothetical protein